MISEYGADTVSGLHVSPSWMFSEDYQSELLIKHHRAFDQLRSQGWFIGEHIWNFADFMTAQGRFYIYIYIYLHRYITRSCSIKKTEHHLFRLLLHYNYHS